ncbi:Putative translocase transmembrane protein [Parasaccharibacter apium]|uniref:Translocase transmembrane protein n=1 Tax=Parasaccharibacter apium TaxID=1510841 RepID=A0A7U7J115_9PROT|nr:Tim44/TimA family putative adaptor protein [Parasaccharibacter apium]MUG79224.1 Tim44/TimA family putative adaptor protein [Bombella sp. ESL0380]CDG34100.1 Putative translocase transmembrane protein [Parasaccharibacter apium]
MTDFPWDIVFWALLAVAVGSAVFFVLGRRMGAQAIRQEQMPAARAVGQRQEGGVADAPKPPPLPGRVGGEQKATEYRLPEADTQLGQALARVGMDVSGFSAEYFLKKAEDIFARTIKAFACADLPALEKVLSPAVLETFSHVLEERKKRHEQVHLELRRIERLDYASVHPGDGEGGACRLGVRIVSWQVSYCRDEKGMLVEGTEALTEFRDRWTFEQGENGQWKVVATEAD